MAKPVLSDNPQVPSISWQNRLRPYVWAIFWMLVVDAVMYLGDRYLVRAAFPWALLSLLLVAGIADIYGTAPALLVLVLSAMFADLIVPDLHISYFHNEAAKWSTSPLRVMLFGICGGIIVFLAHQARTMREDAERRRAVVNAMQGMVLPPSLVAPAQYDIAGLYKPARTEEAVGGDFYDFFPIAIEQGIWGILMGDVMGKGKEAVVYTALLRYSIRAYAHTCRDPGQIISYVADLVENQRLTLQTASVFVGRLDTSTGDLTYANAGHEPPIVVHADGRDDLLAPTGPLLGVVTKAAYETRDVKLGHGDAVLLFTDGLTESRDKDRTFLDTNGALCMLRKALTCETTAGAVRSIETQLSDFTGGSQSDDIALLLLRRQ